MVCIIAFVIVISCQFNCIAESGKYDHEKINQRKMEIESDLDSLDDFSVYIYDHTKPRKALGEDATIEEAFLNDFITALEKRWKLSSNELSNLTDEQFINMRTKFVQTELDILLKYDEATSWEDPWLELLAHAYIKGIKNQKLAISQYYGKDEALYEKYWTTNGYNLRCLCIYLITQYYKPSISDEYQDDMANMLISGYLLSSENTIRELIAYIEEEPQEESAATSNEEVISSKPVITSTPAPTPTATVTLTPSPVPTVTPPTTATPSPSPTPTATITPSPTPTPTAIITPSPVPTPTPTPTLEPVITPELPDQPEGLSLCFKEEKLSVATGKNQKLVPIFKTENSLKVTKYLWESTEPDIVSVSEQGMVKGVKEGHAYVICTAQLSDESKVSAAIEVDVYVPVQGIKINTKNNTKVNVGSMIKVDYNIVPDNATNQKVTWKSLDEAVAVVDKDGRVTAKGAGLTNIIGTTEDGDKTARFVVYVPAMNTSSARVTVDKVSGVKYTFDFYRPGNEANAVNCQVKGKCFQVIPEKQGTKVTVNIIPKMLGQGTLIIADRKDAKCKLTIDVDVIDSAIPDSKKITVESIIVDQWKDGFGPQANPTFTKFITKIRNNSTATIDEVYCVLDYYDKDGNQIYEKLKYDSRDTPAGALLAYDWAEVYMPPNGMATIDPRISYNRSDTIVVANNIPAMSVRLAIRGYHIEGDKDATFIPESQLIWYDSKNRQVTTPEFMTTV